MGVTKKKKKMGGRWASMKNSPIKKKKEDGRPKKKKDGETPIFFMLDFGAHLSPIPTDVWDKHSKVTALEAGFLRLQSSATVLFFR